MLYHIQRPFSVRFSCDWLSWNSLSLFCFDSATLSWKCPFIYPESFFFHGSLTFQRGLPPDRFHTVHWLCCEPYPASQVRWDDGDLSKLVLEFHLNILFSRHWLAATYSRSCVTVYLVCKCRTVCGREGDKDGPLFQAALRSMIWPVLYSSKHISAHMYAQTHTLHQESHN